MSSTGAAASKSNMLLFMERSHPAVLETVRRIVTGENDVAYAAVRDFDANEYSVHVTEDGAAIIVGIRHTVPSEWFQLHCAAELASHLTAQFGAAVEAEKEAGVLCAIRIALPEGDDKGEVVKNPLLAKAASLRTICLAVPFLKYVALFNANRVDFKARLPYRKDESMYVFAKAGHFVVTLPIRVPEAGDRILVRSFLNEFADAKKLDRAAVSGPGFAFFHGQVPGLPEGLKAAEPEDESVFWCVFTLSKKALESPKNTELAVEHLANFRHYVMYHVHCERSVMHSKMRERVKSSLQVLNRAKTSTTGRPRITIQ